MIILYLVLPTVTLRLSPIPKNMELSFGSNFFLPLFYEKTSFVPITSVRNYLKYKTVCQRFFSRKTHKKKIKCLIIRFYNFSNFVIVFSF